MSTVSNPDNISIQGQRERARKFAEGLGNSLVNVKTSDVQSGNLLATEVSRNVVDEVRKELFARLREQRKKALASLRRVGASSTQETSKQLGVQAPESLLGAKQTVLNTTNGGTSLLGGQ